MRGLMIGMFLLLAGSVFAQNALNQLDAQGRKQGAWTKKDATGKVLYQATFKDDKPVGEMKRFHSNGKLKAVMVFAEGSEESDAKLYDERGILIAQGKYIGQKKAGEWNYFVGPKVVSTEMYLNGQKNGVCKRFYQTGELLEESTWKNDKLVIFRMGKCAWNVIIRMDFGMESSKRCFPMEVWSWMPYIPMMSAIKTGNILMKPGNIVIR